MPAWKTSGVILASEQCSSLGLLLMAEHNFLSWQTAGGIRIEREGFLARFL
jgi:hypothetical protein